MIPDYILRQLAEPAPGNPGRHEAWTKLAYQMAGEGIPDEQIFYELRKWIPDKDKPDSELRRAIIGAHRRNPVPADKKMGDTHGLEAIARYDRERKIIRFKVAETPVTSEQIPTANLSTVGFLNALFKPNEVICITNCSIEAGEKLIPGDSGTFWTIEKWAEEFGKRGKSFLSGEAGAWVRINPIRPDDKSGTDASVASFRHLLVEFDSISKVEQWRVYNNSRLPIAAVIDSGGKSLHAWIKVEAANLEEFQERQKLVYEYLSEHIDDRSNINPSRFSRLPGVMRGSKEQKLVAINIGPATWQEFEEIAIDDGLPPIITGENFESERFEDSPFVIEGVLSKGCKMVLGGPSKTKKTWNLIALGLAVANGSNWCGLRCNKGNVLYCNFELKPKTMQARRISVRTAMAISQITGMDQWNLRGKASDIEHVVNRILVRLNRRSAPYDLIIIDPVYKCLGNRDENKAGDMTDFLNHLERLSEETGAAIVFAAHFAKGDHHMKEAIDRISGSGVFVRDPDAICMVTPTKGENSADPKQFVVDIAVRDFPYVPAFKLKWEFPLMVVDDTPDEPKEDKEPGRILRCIEALGSGGLRSGEWEKEADKLKIGRTNFLTIYKPKCLALGLVSEIAGKFFRCNDAIEEYRAEHIATFKPKKPTT